MNKERNPKSYQQLNFVNLLRTFCLLLIKSSDKKTSWVIIADKVFWQYIKLENRF